ncbi:MAG: peptidoglycan-binding protein [Parcubacteria group bacterium]|nr:peptidoglycan-binding protein [Parcubacteria group bacterium]
MSALQQTLINGGFLTAVSAPTGYFGSLTQAALGKWQASVGISPTAGYFGPKTRAYLSSVGGGTGTGPGTGPGPVVIPGTGLALSLAADNPPPSTVPIGAAGVAFIKFNVAGSGTLDSLVFKRKGIGATGDFGSGGLYLYEGNKRITSGKTLNSTTHEVNFVNLAIAVSGVKTLTLVADVAGGATSNNRNYFELVSATGNPTPSGSLVGSEFAIAGQKVGGLDPSSSAAPANPKIGEAGALLAEFKLTASSTEDVFVHRLAMTEGGTINNSHLTNFVLKQNEVAVARGADIGARDLVTLTFDTPFLIEKGQEKIFKLYADVGGLARADDTVVFYFDSATDIYAVGKTYGYPVTPGITNLDATSEGDTITVQGGQITIAFNGPVVGDIPLRGLDVTIFDFTITSQNNVEIKNLRLNATTTGLASGEGFNDFKVWDTASNSVISSATDITTSTAVTVTDVINISAGQSKRMKVTVDVDADNDDSDDIIASLLSFQANDIRNLDNNTYVATSTIVPNARISGNVQDTRVPSLDVQIAATPGSQSIVKGATNQSFVGFSFRAVQDTIKITSLKVSASTTGADATINTIKSDLRNVALYDGDTRVSDLKSFDGSALPGTITFSSLNIPISKGATKVLTVKGDISTAATASSTAIVHFIYVAATSTDITATDSGGNTVTFSGVNANISNTVTVTTLNAGDVAVAQATVDGESKASIVVAGTTAPLAKFRFTATDEQMTVNKLRFLVVPTSTVSVSSTDAQGAEDEVSGIQLFEGGTQIGASSYSVVKGGADAGLVVVDNLGWVIGRNLDKVLTVKGIMNSIDINSTNEADSGANVYVQVASSTFEAAGSTALDTAITATAGNKKVVYRNYPTMERVDVSGGFTANPEVARFRVRAGSQSDISFKVFQLKVDMVGASLTAPTTSNVTVNEMRFAPSTNLTIATVVSGLGTGSTGANAVAGTNLFYLTVYLTNAETIAAGDYKEYRVKATFNGISGTVGASTLNTFLNVAESSAVTSSQSYATTVGTAGDDGNPSFVWSDHSKVSHSETTADWTTGVYIDMPTTSWFLKN